MLQFFLYWHEQGWLCVYFVYGVACCCQGTTTCCKDQGKVSMVGSSLSPVQWEITTKEFCGWLGGSAVSLPLPGVVSENNMFAHMVIMVVRVAFCWQMHTFSSLWWLATTNLSMLIMHTLPDNRVLCKVTLSLGPACTLYPLFQWYPQSKEILLNLIRFQTYYGGCTGKSTEKYM
jgi:hypothetical protein